MTDLAELGLEAANPAIEHYDKVLEPAKDRAKDSARKIREKITSPNKGKFDDEDQDDYYDRSRHRDSRRESGRSRGNDGYVEESYERRVTGPRAKSAGRDGRYGGGGRGLDRDDRRRLYMLAGVMGLTDARRPSLLFIIRLRVLP